MLALQLLHFLPLGLYEGLIVRVDDGLTFSFLLSP